MRSPRRVYVRLYEPNIYSVRAGVNHKTQKASKVVSREPPPIGQHKLEARILTHHSCEIKKEVNEKLWKALVRWATGKRLTNRLPKLILVTLSPPSNSGILGLRMGLYVPTPKFFYNLWGPRESDSSDSWHEEIRFFFKKRFHGGREIRTHDQRPMVFRRRHLWRHYSVGLLAEG